MVAMDGELLGPEGFHWEIPDEGCDLAEIDPRCSSCLTCPLPVCRYELPPGRARMLSQAQALGRLLRTGRTMEEAATELGVSRRTVYRLRQITL